MKPVTTSFLVLVFLAAVPAAAQWLPNRVPGPTTADGNPDFNAAAPRALDGKPDLGRVGHDSAAARQMTSHLYPKTIIPARPFTAAVNNQSGARNAID